MTRGNGMDHNGVKSPILDPRRAMRMKLYLTEPKCCFSAAMDQRTSAIRGVGMGNTGHKSRISALGHAHSRRWPMIATAAALFFSEETTRSAISAILGS